MSGTDKPAAGRATGNRATAGRVTGNRVTVRVSVRQVVETTLHESDLCVGQDAMRRMREGALAHRIDVGVRIGVVASALPAAAEIMERIAELLA